jgi:hypothetical protein
VIPRFWHRTPRRFVSVVVGLPLLAACSGGGGGGGSAPPLVLDSVVASDAGPLPGSSPFLDSRLVLHFSEAPDPGTVNAQTILLRRQSDPNAEVPGTLFVEGSDVVFAPALPTLAGLAGGTFAPGAGYSLSVQSGPNGVRSSRHAPLAQGFDAAFTARASEPLFTASPPGPSRVLGVFLDLDGNGALDADGTCRAQPQAEQRLDAAAPEFAGCAPSGDLVDLAALPIASDVRVGSITNPLVIGIYFSEPLRPDGVLAPGAFFVNDLGTRIDTDGDGVPDSDRPLPFRVELVEEFRQDASPDGRYLVVAKLVLGFTATASTRLAIGAAAGLLDFSSEASAPFSTAIDTGATPPTQDAVVEEFADTSRRGRGTTAAWDAGGSGRLSSAVDLGGGGFDGAFPPKGSGSTIALDTSANGGVFEFTSFSIPAGTVVRADGPNPLVIRSQSDAVIVGVLAVDGHAGEPGRGNDGSPVPGGAGGPGGFAGGRAIPPDPNQCSSATPCFAETGSGPGAGSGGRRANNSSGNSGGGGSGSYGTSGGSGTGGGTPGVPGPTYGTPDVEPLVGGSGGGGGGNKPPSGSPVSTQDSSGGSGGGGGGVVLLECGGVLHVNGDVSARGGSGGIGFFMPGAGPPPSAGGGGGSGGAIKLRAHEISALSGLLHTDGGLGGIGNGNEGDGGLGGFGRIRLEDDDGQIVVQRPPMFFTTSAISTTRSVGQSTWIATNAPNPTWSFDASDPATGLASLLADGSAPASVTDVVYAAPVGPRITVRFLFAGAMPLASNPNEPDPATDTGFVADVAALAGRPFIRFRVEFEGSAPLGSLPPAQIDRLRIRLQYP